MHISSFVSLSLFTILAGGSLGPEAPLVAICAATAGFLSRKVFKQSSKNVVRKHTLMGMAGALSAFFGVPLGGSLFALEVCSRFGIEYFEHLIEAILAGEICIMVFRSLAGLPLEQIWADAYSQGWKGRSLHDCIGRCHWIGRSWYCIPMGKFSLAIDGWLW